MLEVLDARSSFLPAPQEPMAQVDPMETTTEEAQLDAPEESDK